MQQSITICHWTIVAISMFSSAALAAERPNILFIVTDDQRPDTIRSLGNHEIRTPTIDRLVADGMVFTRAICANPICVSSRAEILTGCTSFRAQQPYAVGKFNSELPRWPDTMRAAGYRTWYVGKWHTTGRPITRGYDGSRGLYGSGGGKFPLTHPLDRLGQNVTGYRGWIFQDDAGTKFPDRGVGLTPNISEPFADAAIEVIEESGDEHPFFLHVNFTAPHDPRYMPKGYEKAYDADKLTLPKNFAPRHPFEHGNLKGRDEVLFPRPLQESMMKEELAIYYALVEHIDAQIARILTALKKSGKGDSTIVIFTSDHGLAVGSHGLTGKQNMYEHSIGVPLVVSGPGIPKGVRSTAQCYLRDLFPTICELSGLDAPKGIDGKSLAPVIGGKTNGVHEFVIGYFRNVQRMIRTDRWKLVWYPEIDRYQLFDLKMDPEELKNLISDSSRKEMIATLKAQMIDWLKKHQDPLLLAQSR